MNDIKMTKNRLSDYKAVIFDLDGTLYYQKPFRIKMMCYLVCRALSHPSCIKDILIIKKYREVRENWALHETECEYPSDMDLNNRQYLYVAEIKGTTPERVKKAVSFFMLEAPLKLLPQYRDEVMYSVIEQLREKKITVVIYSDYPVEDKLKALGITADFCFTSADAGIGCMKPAPKGIRVILDTLGIGADEAVMIGDRYEKDGLAAKANNMDYIIVSSLKKERESLNITV